jgi:hypothetical protein
MTMKKTAFVSCLSVCLATLGLAQSASAQPAPEAPDSVEIHGLAFTGTGCPDGSVSGLVSGDRKALTVIFSSFIAQGAPSVAPNEARKFCQLAIDLNFPPGWSFAIMTADYRGFAELEKGVVGTQSSLYYFQGNMGPRFRTQILGPFSDNYFRRDMLGQQATVWSPCGESRALNIKTEASVSTLMNPRGSGMMTVDTVDLAVQQTYGLVWKRCTP